MRAPVDYSATPTCWRTDEGQLYRLRRLRSRQLRFAQPDGALHPPCRREAIVGGETKDNRLPAAGIPKGGGPAVGAHTVANRHGPAYFTADSPLYAAVSPRRGPVREHPRRPDPVHRAESISRSSRQPSDCGACRWRPGCEMQPRVHPRRVRVRGAGVIRARRRKPLGVGACEARRRFGPRGHQTPASTCRGQSGERSGALARPPALPRRCHSPAPPRSHCEKSDSDVTACGVGSVQRNCQSPVSWGANRPLF